jgi:ribosome-binding factor A
MTALPAWVGCHTHCDLHMAKVSNRMGRIADLLRQELAVLIREEMRDPRIGMVSVTDVTVSKDLSTASVYVTILGAEVPQAVDALNQAGGFLRSLLAKNINLRTTPKLRFIYDKSIEEGRHLSALIDVALAQDALHETHEDDQDAGENEGRD